MTHRFNLVVLALVALVGLPFWWFLLSNPLRTAAPAHLDLNELRTLAAAIPGPAPVSAGFLNAGWKRIPGNFYAAGSGMKRRVLGIVSYRLDVPGRGPIVIDSGTTSSLADAVQMEGFEAGRQAELNSWLKQASLVVLTTRRPLHAGGLAALPGGARAIAAPPADRRPRAVAPGVVVVPTGVPGPAAQIVYVRLTNGRELVFAGDLAPFHVNSAELRVRSRLFDLHRPAGEREAMMSWLKALRALTRKAPGLLVLPGHDVDWLMDESRRTRIRPLG